MIRTNDWTRKGTNRCDQKGKQHQYQDDLMAFSVGDVRSDDDQDDPP